MWIRTFDDNLLNMKYMKSIEYVLDGQLVAYMDDGTSRKLCSIKDHDEHKSKIIEIMQQISDEVISL